MPYTDLPPEPIPGTTFFSPAFTYDWPPIEFDFEVAEEYEPVVLDFDAGGYTNHSYIYGFRLEATIPDLPPAADACVVWIWPRLKLDVVDQWGFEWLNSLAGGGWTMVIDGDPALPDYPDDITTTDWDGSDDSGEDFARPVPNTAAYTSVVKHAKQSFVFQSELDGFPPVALSSDVQIYRVWSSGYHYNPDTDFYSLAFPSTQTVDSISREFVDLRCFLVPLYYGSLNIGPAELGARRRKRIVGLQGGVPVAL